MTIDDIGVLELSEAFAAQVVPCRDEWGIDPEKLNPFGGAIMLGHPFGMTGARIAATLLNNLEALDGTIGLETMCVAGGMGQAMIVERLNQPSLAQHLDDEPLIAAVELRVEDGLPRAEVEPAVRHRDDHLVVDEQVLPVRVAVVLAAAVVAEVAGVRAERGRDVVGGSFHVDGGASLIDHSSVSSRMPGSSSLIQTPAVMCMAQTSAMPSSMPDSRTAASTSSVIRTNSRRRSVLLNVR